MSRRKNSVTLLELLIALILLSVVIISLSAVELFSRFHTMDAERRAILQNEASQALEHMTKQISQAVGDFDHPAIQVYDDNRGIRIKIDSNGNGIRDDDSIDLWIAYRHVNISTSDSEIRYYPNAGTGISPAGSYESIAHRVAITEGLTFNLNDVLDAQEHLLENNFQVQIICRWHPEQLSQPFSSDNPEVIMNTSIKMPSVSTN